MGSRLVKWSGGIRLKRRFTGLIRPKLRLNRVFSALGRWFRPAHWAYSRYIRLGQAHYKEIREDEYAVPKGHVAVYVEEGERVVVPVIYVNHPLFGRLLREAEDKYGFDYPGGITLPCHVAEFESVQSLIAGRRSRRKWKSSSSHWG